MAIGDAPQMADGFGVPTFYVTDCIREDAGDGNVRIWNCIHRSGLLVPQCEVIIPAGKLQMIGRDVSEFAFDLYHRHQMLMDAIGARH
jgi:hypothetical protein